jgi:hemerythrin-like domain-containing protein
MTDTEIVDTADYRVIHHCLRIAPHRLAAALGDFRPGDHRRARAIERWWRGYAGEVLAHHTVEDEIFFPQLAHRVPVVADHLTRVEVDHHRLDELMAAADAAMTRLAASASRVDADGAASVVRDLAELMDRHLDFEDEDLVPLFTRHFTPAEYAAMEGAAKSSLSLSQAAFTVPFIMHWAPAAESAELLAGAPLLMRVLYRATRRSHARLTQLALGRAASPSAAIR